MTGFAPEWLALREEADAEARSAELAAAVKALLVPLVGVNHPRLVIRDLGCGTGSMGRWLAGLLGCEQHWVLHDRDPRLLALAAATVSGLGVGGSGASGLGVGGLGVGGPAVDSPAVTVETRQGDLTTLRAGDLAGTNLVTASALLDLLTGDEVNALAAACVEAGVPALFTLSVLGQVDFAPTDTNPHPDPHHAAPPADTGNQPPNPNPREATRHPQAPNHHPLAPPAPDDARLRQLDARFQRAFNDHQRRGGLLGPDAVGAAVAAFEALGARVVVRPSPWRLGTQQAGAERGEAQRGGAERGEAQRAGVERGGMRRGGMQRGRLARGGLAREWLAGWVAAACEQDAGLRDVADEYLRLRDGVAVVVHHADLLAVPNGRDR